MENLGKVKSLHKPVLVKEVLEGLRVEELALSKKAKFIDATVGLGGHLLEIVKRKAFVLGIEADLESLKIARKRLEKACPAPDAQGSQGFFKLVHGNFRNISELAKKNGFTEVDGILFDLGISTYQLEKGERGFSFQREDEPLDMRIDASTSQVTASDLLKVLDKTQLTELFSVILKPSEARKISRKIIEGRKKRDIKSVGDFLSLIGAKGKFGEKLHKATLPFLALRIAVNRELDNLKEALRESFDLLISGGRILVISFHSGEDSIVKSFYKNKVEEGVARFVNKKPILPTLAEVIANPSARSAKLRILEKL